MSNQTVILKDVLKKDILIRKDEVSSIEPMLQYAPEYCYEKLNTWVDSLLYVSGKHAYIPVDFCRVSLRNGTMFRILGTLDEVSKALGFIHV